MQRVESGPLIPPFAAADPVILINLVDLPAGTLGDLPQLALLTTLQAPAGASMQFSPNGRLIVFNSNRSGGSMLWVMTAEGQNQKMLPLEKGEYSTPDWGP